MCRATSIHQSGVEPQQSRFDFPTLDTEIVKDVLTRATESGILNCSFLIIHWSFATIVLDYWGGSGQRLGSYGEAPPKN